ncbi:MAG: prenyltransferase/squalene oxidase repeat-containing protein, partial [Aureliella sp.]
MTLSSIALFRSTLVAFLPVCFVVVGVLPAIAQDQADSAIGKKSSEPTSSALQYQQLIDRSVEYLRQRGQADDGSFSSAAGIGPTGVVVSGLLSAGVAPHDPFVVRSLKYLESNVQPDGGIYRADSSHKNYDTCIAMVALAQANQDGKYQTIIDRAESFVKGLQWDEGEDKDPSDLFYGGAGYGSHSRPDLSNTAYLIDALHTLGNPENDAAIQKALSFVSRCQNLETPANNSEFAAKINDGGFYYTVADGGESKAGADPNGGLRSYGSMTYAGLKSMIYAGVGSDDPRVQAAVDFLRKHYSLEDNPGVGQQGLFYYYQTMAKALNAYGEPKFADASGTEHDWKAELLDKLSELQQPDGSWVNPNDRWMEGDPNLVSG